MQEKEYEIIYFNLRRFLLPTITTMSLQMIQHLTHVTRVILYLVSVWDTTITLIHLNGLLRGTDELLDKSVLSCPTLATCFI